MDRSDKISEIERASGAVLAGEVLPLDLAESWLSRGGPDLDRALQAAAQRITEAFHGRAVRLFAPLYYSNVCVNDCLYCGFRRENRNARRRVLEPEEIEGEARALLAIGHGRILLVASEDPSERGLALALEATRRVRGVREGGRKVAHLGMEVAPGDVARFREMSNAGVDSYVLFQETYDREVYGRVHPDGPKSDFDWRLGAPQRALEGGIPHVGLGVLLGLGEPEGEILALIRHAREIEKIWGAPPRTVSLPRMEPAEGSELSRSPYHPVTDETMFRFLALVRISLPRCGIILSARETAPFRDAALAWGVTEMSAGSRTDPGGYTMPDPESLAQFELKDGRALPEIAAALRARGYQPITHHDEGAAALSRGS